MPQIYLIFFQHKHFGQRNYTALTFFTFCLIRSSTKIRTFAENFNPTEHAGAQWQPTCLVVPISFIPKAVGVG